MVLSWKGSLFIFKFSRLAQAEKLQSIKGSLQKQALRNSACKLMEMHERGGKRLP